MTGNGIYILLNVVSDWQGQRIYIQHSAPEETQLKLGPSIAEVDHHTTRHVAELCNSR